MGLPVTETQQQATAYTSRGRRRDEHAKERILQAALEILDEVGLPNTSVEAIAARAGTGKATVYRWWPDKAAVPIDALREVIAQDLPFPHMGDLHQDVRLHLQNFSKLLPGYRGRVFKAFLIAAQNDAEFAAVFQTIWCEPRKQEAKIGLEKSGAARFGRI